MRASALARPRHVLLVLTTLGLVAAAIYGPAQSQSLPAITSPSAEFGSSIGDDYFLATYTQLERYWKRLAAESDRMRLADIGRTEEGRTQWMAIVSAPENLKQLDRYRGLSRRLALADGLSDSDARALASEGKAVVWIDGGLHANEVLGPQQLIETVYRLVSDNDTETRRILRDVIVLLVDANPDGHELVATWYMREPVPGLRTLAGLPRLYQKYVGHDNNRDFYMASQAETININRVLYHDWLPQIVYDHHQTGPRGTVMFAPPFRDPFNYVLDPLIPVSIDLMGAAMHTRFAAEGKPGVTMRNGSNYSTWWNGGLRTTAYFHNQIGLLTETTGSPTPTEIPFVAERQISSADLPFPIAPQRWHFRQAVDYSLTANRAVLDAASRYRERLLYQAYRMGKNSIDRGSRDWWTISPHRRAVSAPASPGGERGNERIGNPDQRDARAYILPSDQPDFPTATKFIDALLKAGVVVHRATTAFEAAGRSYPAGSYVVRTAQAFRPHVLDMFEPQDYPDEVPYPGATPRPPYDSAGWTLAFQMGVKFDRVLEGVEGPLVRVERATPLPGHVVGPASAAGYLVSHHQNDAFIAVNRLLAAGEEVYWPRDREVGGLPGGIGTMYVPAGPNVRGILDKASSELGLTFTGVTDAPAGPGLRLRPVRIGLWDRYGGSTTSGWTRWILERYGFSFDVVYPQTLDAGDLASRYDAIILTDDAVFDGGGDGAPPEDRIPAEYRSRTGTLTRARTLPRLKEFLVDGGTIVAIGGSTEIAGALGVPVSSALVTVDGRNGASRPLSPDQYYVPASVLRMSVDNTTPLGYGFEQDVDVFFDNSPVFRLGADAQEDRLSRVAWFANAAPLRSGWALGQRYLDHGVTAVDVPVGRGHLALFGPEITFRAQSHGTFRFLFNAIFYGTAVPVGRM